MRHHGPAFRALAATLAMAVVGAACSGSDDGSEGSRVSLTEEQSVIVPQDLESPIFVANVQLTDEGFEPEVIFIPAGRHVRLVLRNRGFREHHYRVIGLVASELRWLQEPEVDEDEMEDLLTAEGDLDNQDVEHVLHHLTPSYVPFKEASLSGIKPLRNEVHGYAQAGRTEVMTFYALATGEYEIEDVRYPEFTGRMVVFDPGSAPETP